ncbi:MAG TPA: inorganic diphosphatase [Sphingomicrobium sp.]|nr:inorganic diphosphatase [Sphingomicrobium sp.]
MPSPIDLPNALDAAQLTCRGAIETPAGSRVKYSFDQASGLFAASKLLPIGLAMPLDFGFIPGTCSGDGDPLDLMVLSEAELAVGCLVTVRLLGAIEVEQGEGKSERNDRLVARLTDSRTFAEVQRLEELGDGFTAELNRFFETYKDLKGQRYDAIAVGGPERAAELIERWTA